MVVGLLKILKLRRSWRWMRGFQPLAVQLEGRHTKKKQLNFTILEKMCFLE